MTTESDFNNRLSCTGDNQIHSIEFPPDGKLRFRKIVRRSNHRPTGKYPSWKAQRMLQWESTNELNAFRLLDADPSVIAFAEQPARISYSIAGVTHVHFPDILVVTHSSRSFWEVKPNFNAALPEIQERTNFLSRELQGYGYEYRLIVADDLSRQPRLDSICNVLALGRNEVPFVDREKIRNIFLQHHHVTWGDVLDGVFGIRGRNHICRLMLEGVLNWDCEIPLNREMAISARDFNAQFFAHRTNQTLSVLEI